MNLELEGYGPAAMAAGCALRTAIAAVCDQNAAYRGIDGVQPQVGEDSHDEGQDGERPQDAALAQIGIGQRGVDRVGDGSVEGALVEPEQVEGAPDDAAGGEIP
jgi:hypothetical protein